MPDTRLSSVVLPDPFGPMIENTCPEAIEMLTPSIARTATTVIASRSASPPNDPNIDPMPPSTTMATNSIDPRNPATSGVMRPLNNARKDPATDAYMAEIMKMVSFWRATSMPSTRAAISLSWMACSARPVGLSIRLSASRNPPTNVAPAIQYQASDPCTRQPNSVSAGTFMPSGPPVQPASLVSTIATSNPNPSVATAR